MGEPCAALGYGSARFESRGAGSGLGTVPSESRTSRSRTILLSSVDAARCVLYLERVPGPTARAFVDANRADPARVGAVLAALGGAVARLHAAGLVHGDLTTSNAVCRAADDVVLIDFGLAGASAQVEDRAVDLYVLERALASTHREADGLVAAVLAAYAAAAADAKQVLRRLDAVRARGRKRECFG